MRANEPAGLTFRHADRAAVGQVIREFGCSEVILVGAGGRRGLASWRRVGEHGGPAFRGRDFDPHQAVLPPSVADPRLHEEIYAGGDM